jgi:hypothetical protein
LGLAVCGSDAADFVKVLELQEQGLTIVKDGVGLEAGFPATLTVDIQGPVSDAYLYWAGRNYEAPWPDTPPYPDQEIVFDGVAIEGDLIGELRPIPAPDVVDSASYVADVTEIVQARGTGVQSFDIEEGDPGSNLEPHVNGAGLIVIYTNPDDMMIYRVVGFDGLGFAYGDPRNTGGETYIPDPILFDYAAKDEDRIAELCLLVGDATPDGLDRVDISDNAPWINEFAAADGASWDSTCLPIFIPAGATMTEVQVSSPAPTPKTDEVSDSLLVTFGVLRVPIEPFIPGGDPCSIGDFVWEDLDHNGIQDGNEPGIEGVTVNLYLADGTFVDGTTTDQNGYYLFTDLPPGEYYVEFVKPDEYAFTEVNAGDDDEVDSDADPSTGWTEAITIGPENCIDLTVDAGFYYSAPPPGTGTPGYWKNHPDAWPVEQIVLGGVSYSKKEAIAILRRPPKGDKKYILLHSLIAATLNVLAGNDGTCIAETIEAANAWYAPYAAKPGLRLTKKSDAWAVGEPLHTMMDRYNNGLLCAPSRDIIL